MNITFTLSYKDYSDEFYVSEGDADWEIEQAIAETLHAAYPDDEDWDDYTLELDKEVVDAWTAAILANADEEIATALLGDESAAKVASIIKDSQYVEYHSGGEYAERYFDDVYGSNSIPEMLLGHIDWQSVFDCEMRYDTDYITLTEGGTSNRIVVYWSR